MRPTHVADILSLALGLSAAFVLFAIGRVDLADLLLCICQVFLLCLKDLHKSFVPYLLASLL